MMWWCVLVLGCLQLQATTSTAAAQPLPGRWGLAPPRPQLTDTSDADNTVPYRLQRFRLRDAPISEPDPEEDLSDPYSSDLSFPQDSSDPALPVIPAMYTPGTKRAFTLLSRWHPFSTLSRNAPSIREQNRQILNDLDIETRAMLRPAGQPLRWG